MFPGLKKLNQVEKWGRKGLIFNIILTKRLMRLPEPFGLLRNGLIII